MTISRISTLLFISMTLGSSLCAKDPYSIRLSKANVEITGLDKPALEQLRTVKWSPTQWQQLLAVYVTVSEETSTDLPPVLGSYKVQKNSLLFVPRFPLNEGTQYRVVFSPARLPKGNSAEKPVIKQVKLPKTETKPTTVVREVYPSPDKLPANLLKFYVHFSAPMSQGGGTAFHHVELLDPKGKTVELPFLELPEELWTRDGKRFTLYVDPGRVKREVKPLVDLGAAFIEGKKQKLVIHATWRDAKGNPLKSSFEKTFTVLPPDRKSPELSKWKIQTGDVGTKQPLTITFDEPLDHAEAHHMISILDPKGRRIDGTVTVFNKETAWRFVPKRPWLKGQHTLMVDGRLEDLAGNNMVKPFEVDLEKTPSLVDRPEMVQRTFLVR